MSVVYSITSMPGAIPLVGHVPRLGMDPLGFIRSASGHGDIVRFRFGRADACLVNHPDLIRRILVDDVKSFDKGVEYEQVRPVFGNGITTSAGAFHLQQRRMIQPAFHKTALERYATTMRVETADMTAQWLDGQVIAVDRAFRLLALRIVTRTLFASEIGSAAVAEFERSFPLLLDTVGRRARSPLSPPDWLPTPRNRAFRTAHDRVWSHLRTAVAGYRRAGTDHGDLLSVLLTARDEDSDGRMTDSQVMDEAMTMLVSGYETTSTTLSWTAHLLSTHPEVQERVRAELDELDGGGPVRAADLPRLPYLRRVITEALRMYPPAWLLTRRTNASVTLGGHRFPAGTRIFLSPYSLHRDAALYPDPDRFDPDRWSAGAAAKATMRGTFLPFGTGVRGCIGEGFAWTELMTAVGTIVSGWRLSPVPGRPVVPTIRMSLQPRTLSLRLTRRTDALPPRPRASVSETVPPPGRPGESCPIRSGER